MRLLPNFRLHLSRDLVLRPSPRVEISQRVNRRVRRATLRPAEEAAVPIDTVKRIRIIHPNI